MIVADSLEARFAARMGALLGPDFPDNIGLAVSGGGDSMAMLALAHGWARVMGVGLHVVTVDHGLRPDSATEAQMVGRECAALGHPHSVLRWHWDGAGNLQDGARAARITLIEQWRGAIEHVLFAHTLDDQAETVVMRLMRGSGVDGLAAMAQKRRVLRGAGFWQIRPLLHETRADLRHYADTLKLPYVDDPSNDDPRFDRVRTRHALAVLEGLGLEAANLAATAGRMARARAALTARVASVASDILAKDCTATGQLVFHRDALAAVERETQLRVLAAALQWVSGAVYRPRAAALEALLDRALAGGGGTLHGGHLSVGRAQIRIFREYNAVRDLVVAAGPGASWDGQWHMASGPDDGRVLRALGPDGWAQIPEKPRDAPPYDAAQSLPAVFDQGNLVACPALQFGPPCDLRLRRPAASFVAFLQLR